MMGISVPIERMVRVAAERWYGYVLERERENILEETLNFEVTERKKGQIQNLREKND